MGWLLVPASLLAAAALSSAAPPVIIDLAGFPSPAILTVEGGATQDQAGESVAVGDLNHDGVADLIVAARLSDPGGRANAGQVYVVYGGAGASGTIFLAGSFTGPRLRGAAALDQLGNALGVGDFDGDQIDDLAVGASWVDHAGRSDAGAVYLFRGSDGPFASVDLSLEDPWLVVWGAAAGDRAGSALVLGDLDGDGRDELIVGAPRAGPAGRIYLVPGSSTPGGQVDLATGASSFLIEGELAGGELGAALAAGRADGDARADLLAGAPYASPLGRTGAGTVYLIRGRHPLADISLASQPAALTVQGAFAGDNLGSAVALGDLDGDGLADIIAGAAGARRSGAASAGSSYGLLWRSSLPAMMDLATADVQIQLEGESSYDKLGTTVITADLDGDGYADLLASAPNGDPPGRPQAGLVYGVSGSWTLSATTAIAVSDLVVYGSSEADRAGMGMAFADITGDAHPDLIIGAPRADSILGMDGGRTYVVPGPITLLPTPEPTPWATYLPVFLKRN